MRVPLTAMAGLAALAVLFPGCADPKRGDVQVFWTFAGQTCQHAGVTSVRINLDGQFVTDQSGILDLPCSSRGIDGTSISPLTPGTHSLYLVGILAGQPSYWLKDLHVSVTQNSTTS